MWQTFPFTLFFRKGNIKRLYSCQNGRGVGRETQRQMKLRGRSPGAGLPLVNSVLRFARKFTASPMLSRSQSCAEKKRERRNLHCLIKCPSTRSWIVLKTESSFSPFKAFRHQKCRFSKNGPQSGVFSCKLASLLETLLSLRNRTAKHSCVINVTGLCDLIRVLS